MGEFGRIDVLVNNAATWSNKRFWHPDPSVRSTWEDWEAVFRVNLTGTMYLSRKVADEMLGNQVDKNRSRGAIIQLTSIHQDVARRLNVEYALSKAAGRMLVKELAAEFAFARIRANGIAPGDIQTDEAKVETHERAPNRFVPPDQCSGLPFKVARAALFLACDYWSSYVTGAIVEVPGGLHLYSHCLDILPPVTTKTLGGSARPSEGECSSARP